MLHYLSRAVLAKEEFVVVTILVILSGVIITVCFSASMYSAVTIIEIRKPSMALAPGGFEFSMSAISLLLTCLGVPYFIYNLLKQSDSVVLCSRRALSASLLHAPFIAFNLLSFVFRLCFSWLQTLRNRCQFLAEILGKDLLSKKLLFMILTSSSRCVLTIWASSILRRSFLFSSPISWMLRTNFGFSHLQKED